MYVTGTDDAGGKGVTTLAGVCAKVLAYDGQNLADLPAAELTGLVESLTEMRSLVEHRTWEAVGAWDATQAWADDGAWSGASWLRHRATLSGTEAAGLVRTARAMRQMPLTSAACGAGEVSAAQARVLARAVSDDTAAAFARDEEMLLDGSRRLDVARTSVIVRHWLALVGPEPEPVTATDRETFLSQGFDGSWDLRGTLDAEGGSLLSKALEELGDELYLATRGDPDATHISAARRRADTLVEAARRALGVDVERAAPPKPSMTVVVPWDVFDTGTGCDTGTDAGTDNGTGPGTEAADAGTRRGDEPSERPGHRPVSTIVLRHVAAQRGDPVASDLTRDALRRLACDASISRIVTGPGSEILDVGRAARTVTEPQRRALVVRDQGCVFPGCDRPPGWTEAHHIVHWADGGPTNLPNLALLCHHHHHTVHDRGFRMTRGPDGSLAFSRPDGTPIR